jgi:hypothetical protein
MDFVHTYFSLIMCFYFIKLLISTILSLKSNILVLLPVLCILCDVIRLFLIKMLCYLLCISGMSNTLQLHTPSQQALIITEQNSFRQCHNYITQTNEMHFIGLRYIIISQCTVQNHNNVTTL